MFFLPVSALWPVIEWCRLGTAANAKDKIDNCDLYLSKDLVRTAAVSSPTPYTVCSNIRVCVCPSLGLATGFAALCFHTANIVQGKRFPKLWSQNKLRAAVEWLETPALCLWNATWIDCLPGIMENLLFDIELENWTVFIKKRWKDFFLPHAPTQSSPVLISVSRQLFILSHFLPLQRWLPHNIWVKQHKNTQRMQTRCADDSSEQIDIQSWWSKQIFAGLLGADSIISGQVIVEIWARSHFLDIWSFKRTFDFRLEP